jgi:hypothetical protein
MHDKYYRLLRTVNCLLRMNSYIFETCRGYYWNKFKRKEHLVASYYAKEFLQVFGISVKRGFENLT